MVSIPPQGCLLLYGTYLAGLTSNVSHPPVNQSPTILTVVTLVTISSTVAVPVSIFLQAWPNLVYSTVAGAIFICTLATNCMLFVPQVRRKRHKEHDANPWKKRCGSCFEEKELLKTAVIILSSEMTLKLKAEFSVACVGVCSLGRGVI